MIEVRTPAAPVEVVTPIKPSEAIRLGCLVAPVQTFGSYGDGREACVLGALVIGLGDAEMGYAIGGNPYVIAAAESTNRPCPEGCAESVDEYLLSHLNDWHRWPRERIADWLEGLGL